MAEIVQGHNTLGRLEDNESLEQGLSTVHHLEAAVVVWMLRE